MKNIFLFLFFISSTLIFNSCFKKGKDDPAISFLSRKMRVVGDWKTTHYYYKDSQTDSSGGEYVYEFTGDASSYNVRLLVPGSGFIGKGTFKMKWSFAKDGTYKEEVSVDGDDRPSDGNWNFMDGVGEFKNKSQIALFEKNYTSSSGLYTHAGNFVKDSYDIIKLKNKEMHLHTTVNNTWPKGEIVKESYQYDIYLSLEDKSKK